MSGLIVNGIVAQRDHQPYIQLLTPQHGVLAQLTMGEARNFAHDVLLMCARTEADAMIHKFFDTQEFPPEAGNHLMLLFREFRHQLDMEKVERFESDPDTGETR